MSVCVFFSGCKKENNALPRILINTDSEIKWDYRTSCDVCCVNDNDTTCYGGSVKFRGGVSSKYYKHSYSLKLDKSQTFVGLPKGKSWIVNATYIDKTFMRHKLCYDIFNNMGEYDVAPQCAYAMVDENGTPRGLYVVMQRINKHLLNIDTHSDNAFIFKEPKLFFADSVMPVRKSPDENFNEQTYPDFDDFGDRSAILDEFHEFIVTSSDDDFKKNINSWIDLRNVVDWHLLLLFTNNGDGVRKNFYLYKIDSETPFRIAIWDCDHSFGRDGDNELNMLERPIGDKRNILLNRLLETDWYHAMLAERWKQLRDDDVISYTTIEKMMQENDRFIQKGLPENLSLWSFDSDFYYDDNNYEQEKALILEFVKMSLDTMDKRFDYGR